MSKKDKALVIEQKEVVQPNSSNNLIEMALKNNVNVETLERLVALKEKTDAQFAKNEFIRAMAEFQKSCPVIEKKKKVKDKQGKDRYSFAPIDEIVSQVKELISQSGLSYTIKITNDDKTLTATCIVTHIAGHSEESSFVVPIGSEEYMTEVQKFGARATFAKRYAFINAFGIMTGDEDNDANTQDVKNEKKDTTNYVDKLIYELSKRGGKTTELAIEVFNNLTGQSIQKLSKGNAKQMYNDLINSPSFND